MLSTLFLISKNYQYQISKIKIIGGVLILFYFCLENYLKTCKKKHLFFGSELYKLLDIAKWMRNILE